MAWTGKEGRFRNAGVKHSTPDRLGPGAYNGHVSIEVEHAYAPFGSLSSRKPPGMDMAGAPPGAYDPKLPGKHDSGLPRREVGFGSSSDRSGAKLRDNLPGPGTYAVVGKQASKQPCRTMGEPQQEQRSIFRSTSAPSIPQGHQSYGYEEVGDGRLQRQGPKEGQPAMTGRPGDSAGPGQYEVPSMLAVQGGMVGKKTSGGQFAQAERLKELVSSDFPGPGHYVTRSEQRGQIARAPMVSSSFVSQCDNRPAPNAEEQPGPGQYNSHRVQPVSLREQHAELQYFGSTVARFKNLELSNMPAPGQYQESPKRMKPAMRPFNSSTGRFQSSSGKAKDTPGPGAYAPQHESPSSGPNGTVSILGAMGGLAFGSMERRGGSISDKKAEWPGPGSYSLPTDLPSDAELEINTTAGRDTRSQATRRVASMPHSMFKSATPLDAVQRAFDKVSKQLPPPGAYDPIHIRDAPTVVRMAPKNEGFLAQVPRFQYSTKAAAPGPGKYEPSWITGGKKFDSFNRTVIEGIPRNGRPAGMGFQSQDKRFKSEADKKPWKLNPGPGTYNVDPGWITRTYNVHFGEVC